MDGPRDTTGDEGCGMGSVHGRGNNGRAAYLPGLLLTAGAVTDLFDGAPWP